MQKFVLEMFANENELTNSAAYKTELAGLWTQTGIETFISRSLLKCDHGQFYNFRF